MGKWDRKRKLCCRLLTSFTERSLSISKRITNVLKHLMHQWRVANVRSWSIQALVSALIWKNQHNVKTVNVVARIFDRFDQDRFVLKFRRCCRESILMKVLDIIIYIMIMKIMRRDFKKIRSSRFSVIQKSAKSPNFE